MSTQFISKSLFFNAPSKHTVIDPLIQPYILGYAYLTRVIYPCEDTPNLNLYEKGLYILIGTSLLIPIVNTILYVALRILCSCNDQAVETDQNLIVQEKESISDPVEPVKSKASRNWSQKISKALEEDDKNTFDTFLEEGKKNNFLNLKHFVIKGTLFHKLSIIEGKNQEYLISLFSAGPDPSSQDITGNTGLLWAIANASNTNALLILQHFGSGPYLDVQSHSAFHKNTALHLAIAKGYKDRSMHGDPLKVSNLELVETLLDLKANPNLQTKEGYTPLHLACVRRDHAMISSLLKAGANPHIKDKEGQMPADLITIGYTQASKILKDISSNCYLLNQEEYEANLDNIQDIFYKI